MQTGDAYTIERLLKNRTTEYLPENLDPIHAPTLILWGKEDSVVPLSTAERLHTAIPNSQMVVFNEAGHIPQIEKASEFNKVLLEFVASK